MKPITPFLLSCIAATLVACASDSDNAGDDKLGGAAAGDPPNAADFEVPEDPLTPAEAKAQAEAEITAENADEEFEKLQSQIQGDG